MIILANILIVQKLQMNNYFWVVKSVPNSQARRAYYTSVPIKEYSDKIKKKLAEQEFDLRDELIYTYKPALSARGKKKIHKYFKKIYLNNTDPNLDRFKAVIRTVFDQCTIAQPDGRLYLGWHRGVSLISLRTVPCFREFISILIGYEMPLVILDIFLEEFELFLEMNDLVINDYDISDYHQIKLDEDHGYYITNLVVTNSMYKTAIYYRSQCQENQFQDLCTFNPITKEDKQMFLWLMLVRFKLQSMLIDSFGFPESV